MELSAVVSLIGSSASALATVVLTGLTAWYVRLTHALVQEAKATKRPNVFVDLEFDGNGGKFLIGNSGASPAFNLRIAVEDSIPWRKLGDVSTGIGSLKIVESGLKYLAPGRTLKFFAGTIERNAESFGAGSEVTIGLAYETEDGSTISQLVTIDLQSYTGVLTESFLHPEREVARAIRDTERDRQSRERSNRLLHTFVQTTCPTCCEQVKPDAKKCPHCLEAIQRAAASADS